MRRFLALTFMMGLLFAFVAMPATADIGTDLIVADLVRGLEINTATVTLDDSLVWADPLADMEPATFDHRACDFYAMTDFGLVENDSNDNSGWSLIGDGSLVAYTRPVAVLNQNGHSFGSGIFDDASGGDPVNTVMPAVDLRRMGEMRLHQLRHPATA